MRYFIGFLITMGLIILLIILLFGGGGKPKVTVKNKTLDSYASTDARVRLTIDGPINATSQHQQVSITVDNNNVVYQHIVGYNGDVVESNSFANTENSYNDFLHALAHAGFTSGNNDKLLRDEKGYCPTGTRYIFELLQRGKTLQRYWATSCSKPKTYLGNKQLTILLFQKQVPDFNKLTRPYQL